jgi:hypothetical protein
MGYFLGQIPPERKISGQNPSAETMPIDSELGGHEGCNSPGHERGNDSGEDIS